MRIFKKDLQVMYNNMVSQGVPEFVDLFFNKEGTATDVQAFYIDKSMVDKLPITSSCCKEYVTSSGDMFLCSKCSKECKGVYETI